MTPRRECQVLSAYCASILKNIGSLACYVHNAFTKAENTPFFKMVVEHGKKIKYQSHRCGLPSIMKQLKKGYNEFLLCIIIYDEILEKQTLLNILLSARPATHVM
jgi:hypothetical protein